jgi:hypothetical protein
MTVMEYAEETGRTFSRVMALLAFSDDWRRSGPGTPAGTCLSHFGKAPDTFAG